MKQLTLILLLSFSFGLFLPSISVCAAPPYFPIEVACFQPKPSLNRKELIQYWVKPANAGDAKAQLCLGLVMRPPNVWIGPANEKRWRRDAHIAAAWIRRSAEQGYAAAQETLALAYERGSLVWDGVSRNPKKARDWMKRSANQCSPTANIYLGQWYRDGSEAVPMDTQLAYRRTRFGVELLKSHNNTAELAALQSYFGLAEEVNKLGRKLTVEDRAKADAWIDSQLNKCNKQSTK